MNTQRKEKVVAWNKAIDQKSDFVIKDGCFNFAIELIYCDTFIFAYDCCSFANGKYAYKSKVAVIDGTTFMLQFAYGFCSFAIGKCAYKLKIALIDGATFMWQFSCGFC